MQIVFNKTFNNKFSTLLLVLNDGKSLRNKDFLDNGIKELISNITNSKDFTSNTNYFCEFNLNFSKNSFQKVYVTKFSNINKCSDVEHFGASLFSRIENSKNITLSVLIEDIKHKNISNDLVQASLASGFNLKNYSFRKYRTNVRPFKSSFKKIDFFIGDQNGIPKLFKNFEQVSEGIFLTRDLVSEPANELYPEKFVSYCKKLKNVGIKLEIFDEKKIKSLGMDALYGVAMGSERPPRVLIMKWNGIKKSKKPPLAFVGKGVTFDTGGISIKPSGGMEDMKWDMGGAAVVAGLLYSLAQRKSKSNVIGIVGLVENMPDGKAQRPGDVVKSMSGQTIEVLNTDAEGRLVLADILHYVNKVYKPELMVDLATLTGAIIVALGDRYAGLFSNSDKLSDNLMKSSIEVDEPIWRLPMDDEFDKLLNCDIADMKNITGTRGAGSITAAQFLKRFVGKTKWAHLDIAGVTWSRNNKGLSRPGGTGFGVRLLDNFVKKFHE